MKDGFLTHIKEVTENFCFNSHLAPIVGPFKYLSDSRLL